MPKDTDLSKIELRTTAPVKLKKKLQEIAVDRNLKLATLIRVILTDYARAKQTQESACGATFEPSAITGILYFPIR